MRSGIYQEEGRMNEGMNEIGKWIERLPLIEQMTKQKEVLWVSPLRKSTVEGLKTVDLTAADVKDAADRSYTFRAVY